jgi:hypothetical protein
MRMPLNIEDLTIESVVIGPTLDDEASIDSQAWYTNTRPMPASTTGCSSCYA